MGTNAASPGATVADTTAGAGRLAISALRPRLSCRSTSAVKRFGSAFSSSAPPAAGQAHLPVGLAADQIATQVQHPHGIRRRGVARSRLDQCQVTAGRHRQARFELPRLVVAGRAAHAREIHIPDANAVADARLATGHGLRQGGAGFAPARRRCPAAGPPAPARAVRRWARSTDNRRRAPVPAGCRRSAGAPPVPDSAPRNRPAPDPSAAPHRRRR